MKKILIIVLFVLFNATLVGAGDFTVSWDANTEPDLAGYKVYYGTVYREYGTPIDVGNQTGHVFTNMPTGVYHIAVTAYDTSGNESVYSYEVVIQVIIDQVKGLREGL